MRNTGTASQAQALREIARMDVVTDTVKGVATSIRDDARRLAPKRTGTLSRRGIGIEKSTTPRTRYVRWLVGWTKAGWYGWLVENGTEHVPPRPHLVPAAIKHGAGPGGEGDA